MTNSIYKAQSEALHDLYVFLTQYNLGNVYNKDLMDLPFSLLTTYSQMSTYKPQVERKNIQNLDIQTQESLKLESNDNLIWLIEMNQSQPYFLKKILTWPGRYSFTIYHNTQCI